MQNELSTKLLVSVAVVFPMSTMLQQLAEFHSSRGAGVLPSCPVGGHCPRPAARRSDRSGSAAECGPSRDTRDVDLNGAFCASCYYSCHLLLLLFRVDVILAVLMATAGLVLLMLLLVLLLLLLCLLLEYLLVVVL